jgi:hypothetical protein
MRWFVAEPSRSTANTNAPRPSGVPNVASARDFGPSVNKVAISPEKGIDFPAKVNDYSFSE